MIEKTDAIVIGAGHAGAEAALALSRLGNKTLLITMNLDSVAYMACNPSIGGTAKGHLVREIDALGGEMGVNADNTMLQIKMLNRGKGPAVHSLRAQADKSLYHRRMKSVLENAGNLDILQDEVTDIIIEGGAAGGVVTSIKGYIKAKAVVICAGVYLNSKIIIGEFVNRIGPSGFAAADKLTQAFLKLNIPMRRFKTGTPPRLDARTIDYGKTEVQHGEDDIYTFSAMTDISIDNEKRRTENCGKNKTPQFSIFNSQFSINNQTPCYLTYTNAKTHKIILDNLHRAPLYNGAISGTGARYCPSVEVKVERFKDKDRHQIFLEPEGAYTNEVYCQGLSTSLPADLQEQLVHSIKGLENAKIIRYAYAIEYDCIDPLSLLPTLQIKNITGLYSAGQINGSSGYEEAGAQGLIAGINASQYIQGKEPFILGRGEAYIGVLTDDLVTKGTNEPYRMMTARAEHRIYLRQDNADMRLTEKGYALGLATKERLDRLNAKKTELEKIREKLKTAVKYENKSVKAEILLKRPEITAEFFMEKYDLLNEFNIHNARYVISELKYEGYLTKEKQEAAKTKALAGIKIPEDFNYSIIKGLRTEAREKLDKVRPLDIGQASRISGVSPADITVLLLYLKK